MNITCAILHNNPQIAEKLEDFISQTSFFTLCGNYECPEKALSAYYQRHIQLFFIGIENEYMEGYQFCQFISPPTRVIFISTSKEPAADCFRVNECVDYLLVPFTYSVFLEGVNKAIRWFCIQKPISLQHPELSSSEISFIYIKSEYKLIRLEKNEINYIEGLGDYIKIYCCNTSKPILSLCSIKSMEQILPKKDFIRIHRSYIVRKSCINIIERSNIILGKVRIPIGDSYRRQFQEYVNQLPIF